jgi:hypothetical protein
MAVDAAPVELPEFATRADTGIETDTAGNSSSQSRAVYSSCPSLSQADSSEQCFNNSPRR